MSFKTITRWEEYVTPFNYKTFRKQASAGKKHFFAIYKVEETFVT